MKKIVLHLNLVLLILLLIQPSRLYSQTSGYRIINVIEIGGIADWDYLSELQPRHLLFVSHDTEVVVINLKDNSAIGRIGALEDAHGTAFAPEFGKGFISDGGHNSVVIFNLRNFKVIKRVKTTGTDPDAILYDPSTNRVFAFNGHGTSVTAIDAKTNKVVGKVKLSGSPEFGVSDFKGRLFVNIEKKNEINVIDPKSLKVINKWPIPPCVSPSAMAIDRKNNKLFVGARNKIFAVVDANSGKVIATFPIGSGVDACRFDPQTKLIFCSNKDGTMSVIRQDAPARYSFVENIATPPRAKTMELDETTHRIYTSTMIDTGHGGKSFGVLVLDPK